MSQDIFSQRDVARLVAALVAVRAEVTEAVAADGFGWANMNVLQPPLEAVADLLPEPERPDWSEVAADLAAAGYDWREVQP